MSPASGGPEARKTRRHPSPPVPMAVVTTAFAAAVRWVETGSAVDTVAAAREAARDAYARAGR